MNYLITKPVPDEADLRANVDSELHDRSGDANFQLTSALPDDPDLQASVNSELHHMSGEENCQLIKPVPDGACPQACPRATPGGISREPPCYDEWIHTISANHPIITPPEELWPTMYQLFLDNWTASASDSACA